MRIRIIAIVAALLCGALWMALSGWTSASLLNWFDGLSARHRSLLRTWIIFSGALIPVLAVALRRPNAEADEDQDA